jgi:hypothetical protein
MLPLLMIFSSQLPVPLFLVTLCWLVHLMDSLWLGIREAGRPFLIERLVEMLLLAHFLMDLLQEDPPQQRLTKREWFDFGT